MKRYLLFSLPAVAIVILVVFLYNQQQDKKYSSLSVPRQIILTCPGSPDRSIAVSWRTGSKIKAGLVEYRTGGSFFSKRRNAEYEVIDGSGLIAIIDYPVIHRFSAILNNLESNKKYEYRACSMLEKNKKEPACSLWYGFTTAPGSSEVDFTFMYLGDAQNELEEWSLNYNNAIMSNPDVRFTLLAGDIINDGGNRVEYDRLFSSAQRAFASTVFFPVMGNHDLLHNGEDLYRKIYVLPENGSVEPEHDYWIKYGGLLLIVLDSNDSSKFKIQARWMQKVILKNPSTWVIVSFHHPVWSAEPERDNPALRDLWTPVFEKSGVHLILTGHDHSYMRTYPILGGKIVKKGPVYVVSVSGRKMYQQQKHPFVAKSFTNIPTYQLIRVKAKWLEYYSYTWDDKLMDSFVIKKNPAGP